MAVSAGANVVIKLDITGDKGVKQRLDWVALKFEAMEKAMGAHDKKVEKLSGSHDKLSASILGTHNILDELNTGPFAAFGQHLDKMGPQVNSASKDLKSMQGSFRGMHNDLTKLNASGLNTFSENLTKHGHQVRESSKDFDGMSKSINTLKTDLTSANDELKKMGSISKTLRKDHLIPLDKELQQKKKDFDSLNKAVGESSTGMKDLEKSTSKLKKKGKDEDPFKKMFQGAFKFIKIFGAEFAVMTGLVGAFQGALWLGQLAAKGFQIALQGVGIAAGAAVAGISTALGAVRELSVAKMTPILEVAGSKATGATNIASQVSAVMGDERLGMFDSKTLGGLTQEAARQGQTGKGQLGSMFASLGDFAITAADPNKALNKLATGFMTAQKAGKFTKETFDQISKASPEMVKGFEEMYGGADGLKSALGSGKVSADGFLRALDDGRLKSMEPFKDSLDNVNDTLIGRFKGNLAGIKEQFTLLGGPLVDALKGPLEKLSSTIKVFVMQVGPAVQNVFGKLFTNIGNGSGITRFSDALVRLTVTNLPKLLGMGTKVRDWFRDIKGYFSGVGDWLKKMSTAWDTIFSKILKPLGTEVWDTIVYAIKTFNETIGNSGTYADSFGQRIHNIFEAVRSLIDGFGKMKEALAPIVDSFMRLLSVAGQLIKMFSGGGFGSMIAAFGMTGMIMGRKGGKGNKYTKGFEAALAKHLPPAAGAGAAATPVAAAAVVGGKRGPRSGSGRRMGKYANIGLSPFTALFGGGFGLSRRDKQPPIPGTTLGDARIAGADNYNYDPQTATTPMRNAFRNTRERIKAANANIPNALGNYFAMGTKNQGLMGNASPVQPNIVGNGFFSDFKNTRTGQAMSSGKAFFKAGAKTFFGKDSTKALGANLMPIAASMIGGMISAKADATDETAQGIGGALSGMGSGAMLGGAVAGPMGAVVGGLIGGGLGFISGGDEARKARAAEIKAAGEDAYEKAMAKRDVNNVGSLAGSKRSAERMILTAQSAMMRNENFDTGNDEAPVTKAFDGLTEMFRKQMLAGAITPELDAMATALTKGSVRFGESGATGVKQLLDTEARSTNALPQTMEGIATALREVKKLGNVGPEASNAINTALASYENFALLAKDVKDLDKGKAAEIVLRTKEALGQFDKEGQILARNLITLNDTMGFSGTEAEEFARSLGINLNESLLTMTGVMEALGYTTDKAANRAIAAGRVFRDLFSKADGRAKDKQLNEDYEAAGKAFADDPSKDPAVAQANADKFAEALTSQELNKFQTGETKTFDEAKNETLRRLVSALVDTQTEFGANDPRTIALNKIITEMGGVLGNMTLNQRLAYDPEFATTLADDITKASKVLTDGGKTPKTTDIETQAKAIVDKLANDGIEVTQLTIESMLSGEIDKMSGLGADWAKALTGILDKVNITLSGQIQVTGPDGKIKNIVLTSKLGVGGGKGGDIGDPNRHSLKGGVGDTTSARLARTLASHAALNGTVPGSRSITSSFRTTGLGSPSSDHLAGAAYDLTGDNLGQYAQNITDAGGFAEFHGSAGSRHLHVVPAQGDTASPMAGGTAAGGSVVTINAPINITARDGQSAREIANIVMAELASRERSARERA